MPENKDENIHKFAVRGKTLEKERGQDKENDTKSFIQKSLTKVKSWNCRKNTSDLDLCKAAVFGYASIPIIPTFSA